MMTRPPGVAREVILEPQQRLEIEVVGRLVEHQQRGLADQQAGEMRAHDPAAGEGLGLLVVVGFAEAQAGQDFLGARLERPVDVVVVVGFRDELLAARGDRDDRFLADRRAFLRQIAEIRPALPFDRAFVGLLLAEDQVEERGFARAIGPDEAETVGARDEKRYVREQFSGTVGLGNVGKGQHVNPRVSRSRPPPSIVCFAALFRGRNDDSGRGFPGARAVVQLPAEQLLGAGVGDQRLVAG